MRASRECILGLFHVRELPRYIGSQSGDNKAFDAGYSEELLHASAHSTAIR